MRTIDINTLCHVFYLKTVSYKEGGEIRSETNDEGRVFRLPLKKAEGDGLKRANAVLFALESIKNISDEKNKNMQAIALLAALLNSSSKAYSYIVAKGLIESNVIPQKENFNKDEPLHYNGSAEKFVAGYTASLSADDKALFDKGSAKYETEIKPFGLIHSISSLFAKKSSQRKVETGTELPVIKPMAIPGK